MTIMGKPSIAELRDLIRAKNYTVNQIQQAYNAFQDEWWTRDSASAQRWALDWDAFRARYRKALDNADLRFAVANAMIGVSDDLIPAEEAYNGVLRALTMRSDGSFDPTDIQGLYDRLNNALVGFSKAPIDLSKTPQPGQHDADLSLFATADLAMKNLEAVQKEVQKKKDSFFSNPLTWIGGAAALYIISRR